MIGRFRTIAVFIVVVAMIALLSWHQLSNSFLFIPAVAGAVTSALPFLVPAIGDFIIQHPREMRWTGVFLGVAGTGATLYTSLLRATNQTPSFSTDGLGFAAFMTVGFAGFVLAALPGQLEAARRTRTALQTASDANARSMNPGYWEGLDAIVTTAKRFGAFLRLCGPWILLVWAVPIIGLRLGAYCNGIISQPFALSSASEGRNTDIFWVLLPLAATVVLAYPTALVAWHRYIIENRVPRSPVALPDIQALHYCWRLWRIAVTFLVFNRMADAGTPDLVGLFGIADQPVAIASLLKLIAIAIGISLAAEFALPLPAVAVGDRNVPRFGSWRRTHKSYPLGFALSVLPIALVAWATYAGLAFLKTPGLSLETSVAAYAIWLLPTAAAFFTLASGATYVSRIYRELRASSPIG